MPLKLKVKDVMSLDLHTVRPSTTLEQALNKMLLHNIKCLPVVDLNQRLVGLITDRDIRLVTDSPLLGMSPEIGTMLFHEHTVSEVMQTELCVVDEEQPLWEAADAMRVHDIGGLPVLNHLGELTGVITRTDMLNVLLEVLDPVCDEVVLLTNPIMKDKEPHPVVDSSEALNAAMIEYERQRLVGVVHEEDTALEWNPEAEEAAT